jgi:hypothetical protein
MFNNCRIPKKPSDHEAIYDPTNHNHIIAIRKNKFYVIHTIHDGQQLSTSELQHQFQCVIDLAGQEKGVAIGALTGENRDIWTDVSIECLAEGEYQSGLPMMSLWGITCIQNGIKKKPYLSFWCLDRVGTYYWLPIPEIEMP